ncbi:glycosyltransferase [Alloyangia pacifica]|uniref:Glycosyltransferase, GT2 family n=1 Tax=Alloyangia pacifica TaxID=311180 RepID=A0A1I6RLF2_9RHOB|nr:glycosyltransferase [Alloyangia pacifica]SDI69886.1 Glycosyltransferase, GT2 family [Alloyangia pacifica]SFS65288.1 Glycosyltransferase, GT2 family [Alloyangia pacifica]
MLGQLSRIFRRYAEMNLALDRPGVTLTDPQGRAYGEITRIALRRHRIHVEGWAEAERVGLSVNRTRAWTVPAVIDGGSARRGFSLDIPCEAGPLDLLAERAAGQPASRQSLPGFSRAGLLRARLPLALRFARSLAVLAPLIHRWKWQGDLGARETVKERLGLVPRSEAVEIEAALLPETPPAAPPERAATLILPVYNAADLLPETLARIARNSGDAWRLLLIDDASPDPRVRPLLRDWAAGRPQVTLLENPANLGFIGTVNRGFAEARARWPGDPVVLVNSDAMVPPGWLPRLLAPLGEPDVASVTPMSNDAEIFTVPVICQRNDLAPGDGDALDAAAAGFDPRAGLAEAPTGVGFCMALAPRFLAQVPEFDTTFGRGYGEENDWCRKVAALGGRHLCASNLFVEHRGGQSFGNADKQRLLERNLRVIAARYPEYDAEVQEFIRRDPLATGRLALGLVLAAQRQAQMQAQSQAGPVPVYLAHALGGGAESYLQGRIAQATRAGQSALVLRVGQGHRWKLELHGPSGATRGLTNDFALVARLVALLPERRIVYSCGVGARDAAALPGQLLQLAGQGGEVEVLLHDFFPISPSYTLLGDDGAYHGVPRAGQGEVRAQNRAQNRAQDRVHRYQGPDGRVTPLAEWQENWGRLLAAARRIEVFSGSSRDILAEAYPQVAARIAVVPHALPAVPPRIAPGTGEGGAPVIGVLGNIGAQKGAALLQEMSRALARSGAARLVVLGQLDPAYALAAPSLVHGSYELRDLPGLVARYGICGWLMPSIWPETFSFTTHEMLATGLPVVAFDLGAQGEAVARAAAQGAPAALLPLRGDAAAAARGTLAALRDLQAARGAA